MAIQYALYEAERLLMSGVEFVWCVENTKVLSDAGLLDVGIAARPLHRWSLQAVGSCPVTAEAR